MATIRSGTQTVLLVVDVQVGVVREAWDAPRVVNNIQRAVDKARRAGTPVIWVQHADEELAQGSAAWQLAPELSPAQDETRLDKHFNSCFEQTPLDEILARMNAAHIVLTGAATNWCIRATAYAALDRGYDLTLVGDAHTTGTIEFQDGSKIEAADIVRELNIAMQWLSYPGRVNRTVSADELSFAD